jgi:uncharacterized phage protein gp47/JayE
MTDPLPTVTVTPTGYIAIPVTADSTDLATQALAQIGANLPGWVPRDGNLEVWLTYALARMAATSAQVAGQASQAIYQYFGQSVLDVAPLAGSMATVQSTWTVYDTAGHTIPAGTIVGISTSLTTSVLFEVTDDVVIPPGSSATSAGAVTLLALEAGSSANGLEAGTLQLFSNLAWVSSVVSTAATSGGSDPETTDAYLDRLRARLKLLSPRPILPGDFAAIAADQPGVQRATALNGYNPADGTSGNARMVTVAAVDAAGNALGLAARDALAAVLDAMREVNFVVNVISPTTTPVTVSAQVVGRAGVVLNTVQADVLAAVQAFLSPVHWGDTLDDNGAWTDTWTNTPTVRYLDVAAVIKDVPGVAWVASLAIGIDAGAQVPQDGQLPGAAPLPTPGSIAITMIGG